MKHYTKYLNNMLRSADAVDSSDPFDTETGSIDTSFPIILAANYRAKVTKAELVDGKSREGSKNLKLTLVTLDSATTTKGETIEPGGITLFTNISVTPSDDLAKKKASTDLIKKRVARWAKACGLPATTTVNQVINDAAALQDKDVVIKVGISKETAEFPERNEVKDVVLEG